MVRLHHFLPSVRGGVRAPDPAPRCDVDRYVACRRELPHRPRHQRRAGRGVGQRNVKTAIIGRNVEPDQDLQDLDARRDAISVINRDAALRIAGECVVRYFRKDGGAVQVQKCRE